MVNPKSPVPLDDPSLYIHRDLSWLEFNRQVLGEAQDSTVPLLERLKFLAIFESNLDEFFMVRMGRVQQKVQAGIQVGTGADRTPPSEIRDRIYQSVGELTKTAYQCFQNELRPKLEKEGLYFVNSNQLTPQQREHVETLFQNDIFPVLTPLAIDKEHPFPHLLNKSLNMMVALRKPGESELRFVVVQVPSVLPRFISLSLPQDKPFRYVFIAIEYVIKLFLSRLFPGMILDHDTIFRITRNSDIEIEDDDVEDLLKTIEEKVRKRRLGDAVRLQIESNPSEDINRFLLEAFDLEPGDVFPVQGMLDLTGLFQIHGLPDYPLLRDPPCVPQPLTELANPRNPWSTIRSRDILMHHPYESFTHVIDFIDAAANDDRVLAIKQTLYRTSSDSPIVRALQRAADKGKQVTAVIELKARLDEERNIVWAKELEKSGVHVVFGLMGLKTHCKVALVVRREEDGIRRYVHLCSGNYNPQTARIYTDLGFFTCKEDFCEDVSALFNYLTGYCEIPQWRKLVIAPHRMQSFLIEKIDQEAYLQKTGKQGRIIAKINGILEPAIVKALYRASQSGVRIDLICRGVCSLRPGIPGVSDNIRVISIVDRFLEHSRIIFFGNDSEPQVYIGSADWMDRNLSRRVEVLFPVEQPDLKQRLIRDILAISLADNVKARELMPDGSYRPVSLPPGQAKIRSQERFLEMAIQHANRHIPSLDSDLPSIPFVDNRSISSKRQRRKRTS